MYLLYKYGTNWYFLNTKNHNRSRETSSSSFITKTPSNTIHGAMNNWDNAGSHDFPFDSCIPSMTRGTFTDEYLKWLFLRYNTSKDETNEAKTQKISSFSSLKTSLTFVNLTCITLTPISPYSATNYYVIYMVMLNFQDVLQQRHQSGTLWHDEGVYHIVKELQLHYSNKHTNIFLGLGGFHMEKILFCVIGQFLCHIGAWHVFV